MGSILFSATDEFTSYALCNACKDGSCNASMCGEGACAYICANNTPAGGDAVAGAVIATITTVAATASTVPIK